MGGEVGFEFYFVVVSLLFAFFLICINKLVPILQTDRIEQYIPLDRPHHISILQIQEARQRKHFLTSLILTFLNIIP